MFYSIQKFKYPQTIAFFEMAINLLLAHKLIILVLFFVVVFMWKKNSRDEHYKRITMGCVGLGLVYLASFIFSNAYVAYAIQTLLLTVILYMSYGYYTEGLIRRRTELREMVLNPTPLHKEIEKVLILPQIKKIEKKNR